MMTFLATIYILIGTYTGGESEGIYVYKFDTDTARTEYVGMTRVENPSYLTSWSDTVYAVSENGDGTDAASAFRFSDGELTHINTVPTGVSPCNIATNDRLVVTANYGGGDVSVFGMRKDGGLTASRQKLDLSSYWRAETGQAPKSHFHCVKFSPDGRFLFAADLGTDRLLRWDVRDGEIDETSLRTFPVHPSLDLSSEQSSDKTREDFASECTERCVNEQNHSSNEASGSLSRQPSGPRHFIFSDDGDSVYLINELSGAVVAFDYNGGDLVLRQIVDADPADGGGSADIVLSADQRFLYASNRLKNDGIAIFDVGAELTEKGYKTTGEHPRNLSMSPDGRFLLVSCRDSDVVQIFSVDQQTGALTPTQYAIDIDQPVCVYFLNI